MITLHQWAMRHGIAPEALRELTAIMCEVPTDPKLVLPGTSEAAISNMVRVEASDKGAWLLRNQVGACMDDRGRQIRFGLANDSKQMNQQIKSCDLIGIKPVLITPDHVGSLIGQFMGREVKKADWKFNPNDERAVAQLRFMNRAWSLGADVAFANGVGTV